MLIYTGSRANETTAILSHRERELEKLLHTRSGVITRAEACAVVSLDALEYALRSGQLVAVHRGVYASEPISAHMRCRAALIYCGVPAALSHTTALAVWRVLDDAGPIHLTTTPARLITGAGLVVHRSADFASTDVRRRSGCPSPPSSGPLWTAAGN